MMDPKEELLNRTGYSYNFNRMAYMNRMAKKVFSVEAVEDHPIEWLNDKIAEENNGNWRFYFNDEPSPAVKKVFLEEFGEKRAAS
jgi:hypothetical protein